MIRVIQQQTKMNVAGKYAVITSVIKLCDKLKTLISSNTTIIKPKTWL